jgi:hypothetical protein
MNSLANLSAKQLRRAAGIKDKINSLQKELNRILGTTAENQKTARKKRRKMSAAGRAKIAAAQKARWAKIKAANKK